MTVREQEEFRQRAIADAMGDLLPNPNFQQFIGVLRDQREVVIDDLCRDDSIKSERSMMALVGELRALKGIIAVYEEYKRREQI
jgi:hypothetical protein